MPLTILGKYFDRYRIRMRYKINGKQPNESIRNFLKRKIDIQILIHYEDLLLNYLDKFQQSFLERRRMNYGKIDFNIIDLLIVMNCAREMIKTNRVRLESAKKIQRWWKRL